MIRQWNIDTVLSPHVIFEKISMTRFLLGCTGSGLPLGIKFAMNAGMDNSINKASVSLLAMATLVIAAIAAKIRATAEAQAPEGYEDATGFHFGSKNHEG
jgi:hypothetical protein